MHNLVYGIIRICFALVKDILSGQYFETIFSYVTGRYVYNM